MTPDPKWLNIIKSSNDRLAVAIACGLFLLANHWRWLPPLPDWVLPAAWFGLFLFGCLWAVELIQVLFALIDLILVAIRNRPRS